MWRYRDIEAVRFEISRTRYGDASNSYNQIRIQKAGSVDYISILRHSIKIYKTAAAAVNEADRIFWQDLETRQKTDGRVVDISMPVRMSGGIYEIASLIQRTDDTLLHREARMNRLADSADFVDSSEYQRLAREALNSVRDYGIVDICRLHIHSHLWMLWAWESLEQANQIRGLMKNPERYNRLNERTYALLAHQPILVSVLSCTALIERLGWMHNHRFGDGELDKDNTNFSGSLDKISSEYEGAEQFDISAIRDQLTDTRNNLSHYLLKRADTVTSDSLQEFINAAIDAVMLSKAVADDLAEDVLSEYELKLLEK